MEVSPETAEKGMLGETTFTRWILQADLWWLISTV